MNISLSQITNNLQIHAEKKVKHVMEKDHSQRYTTITCIEHKNKKTGTIVLIHPQDVEKQYH